MPVRMATTKKTNDNILEGYRKRETNVDKVEVSV